MCFMSQPKPQIAPPPATEKAPDDTPAREEERRRRAVAENNTNPTGPQGVTGTPNTALKTALGA